MFETPLSRTSLIIFLFLSIVMLTYIHFRSLFLPPVFVVFCNVGQGDAAYVRVYNLDIVVDTGPNKSILMCLQTYMKPFDKTIDLLIVSHEEKDHTGGLYYLKQHYNIASICNAKNCLQGKYIHDNMVQMRFLWPPFGYESLDKNNKSVVVSMQINKSRILFTGDLSLYAQLQLIKTSNVKTDILKIPHHGSQKSISSSFLRLADPTLAVISVGRNNSYGHPSQPTLDLLKALRIPVRRTDVEGDIVIQLTN